MSGHVAQAMTKSFDPRKIAEFLPAVGTADEMRPFEQVTSNRVWNIPKSSWAG